MSTDKNFSTADNNDPQPPVEKQSASNNPENSQQEPKYTQLYGLEGADGKISLDPQASRGSQGAEGKEEPYQHTPKQFDIDPKTHEALLIAQGTGYQEYSNYYSCAYHTGFSCRWIYFRFDS